MRWITKRDDGGTRLATVGDLKSFAKVRKDDGTEICPEISYMLSAHEGKITFEGYAYVEDEEAGLYKRTKI